MTMNCSQPIEKVPVCVTELLKLGDLDVPPEQVTWQRVSLLNDQWICVRHDLVSRRKSSKNSVRTGAQVVTVANLYLGGLGVPTHCERSESGGHLAIRCQSAKINPNSALLCVLVNRHFQVFDLDSQNHPIVSNYIVDDNVTIWNWLSATCIGIVTQRGIFVWHPVLNDSNRSEKKSDNHRMVDSSPSPAPPHTIRRSSENETQCNEREQVRFLCSLDSRLFGKQVVQLTADSSLRWVAVTALYEDEDHETVNRVGLDSDCLDSSSHSNSNSQNVPMSMSVSVSSTSAKTKCDPTVSRSGSKQKRCGLPKSASSGDATHRPAAVRGIVQLYSVADKLTQCIVDAHCVAFTSYRFSWNVSPSTVLLLVTRNGSITGNGNGKLHIVELQPVATGNLAPTQHSDSLPLSVGGNGVDRLGESAINFASSAYSTQCDIAVSIICSTPSTQRLPPASNHRSMLATLATSASMPLFVSEHMKKLTLSPDRPSQFTSISSDTKRSNEANSQDQLLVDVGESHRMNELEADGGGSTITGYNSAEDSYGFAYVVTKYGRVHVCDVETATMLFTVRVASIGDVVFAAVPNRVTHGLLCVTRSGKVLAVDLNNEKLVAYLASVCRNKHGVADRIERQLVASRAHLKSQSQNDPATLPNQPDSDLLLTV